MTGFTRCIVHAGTHKTGTTSFQDVLAAHRSQLAAAGYSYPTMGAKGRDHNALAHRLATCNDDELPALRDQLAGGAAELGVCRDGGATLLLSAEELSTRIRKRHPWAGFDDGAYWQHRRQYLARLRSVLPAAAKVQVFVCFRDHESYAHALYATKVLSGWIDWSFGDFVRRCAPIFDYGRQAEVLAETLGPVHARSFGQLRDDLVNRSFEWLGLPLQVEQTPRLRPTPALDLIHWLVRTKDRDERKRRAAFCLTYQRPAGNEAAAALSLWASAEARQDFLRQCRPPPLQDWPSPPAAGAPIDAAWLESRADEIEAEYRQCHPEARPRKRWPRFWRR